MENLENLIGSKVRIFRGGPESRDGVLLDKQSDYLTLYTKQDGVVYYNLHHIKSVIKNAKDGHISSDDEELCMKADSFQDLLKNLKGSRIQIDRGGPESRDGKLLDVLSDYIVLENKKEGVIYYKTHHIKSVSVLEQKAQNDEQHDEDNSYVCASDFKDLLKELKYSWVKINRGGPEKIEGVLVDSSGDYLILTVNDEVNRIPVFHIRSLSVIENELKMNFKKEKDEKNETGDAEETQAEDAVGSGEEDKQVVASDVSEEDHTQNHSDEASDDEGAREDEESRSEQDSDEENEDDRYRKYDPPGPVWINSKIQYN